MTKIQSPTLSESQKAVLQKYLVEGETTWQEVSERVCRFVAGAEKTPELQDHWHEQFMSIVLPMKFVPAGSILANSNHGTESLLNCFVASCDDNLRSIMDLVHDSVMTTKHRGGVGINIGSEGQPGYIRPKGAPFRDGQALGACATLDMVSDNAKKITTGNKARRGAFMFSMDWRHPEIWEFIQAKNQSKIDADIAKKAYSGELSAEEMKEAWVETHLSPKGKRDRRWHNANISVQLDDEFFDLLKEAQRIDDQNKEHGGIEYVLRMGVLEYKHAAKLENVWLLWDAIATNAHRTADPGLLFIDNAKRRIPIRDYILTTNPCGELFLPKNSACNLGSLVLTKFVSGFGQSLSIDWADLRRTVHVAVRFLDNVLAVSKFATEGQKHNVQNVFRQIGLGVMGWADYLNAALVPYDSQKNLDEIKVWGGLIAREAYRASADLAVEKGPCGIWDKIKDVETGNPYDALVDGVRPPRRNSTVLSVAPTGSIAQLAGCSWAFEPHFGLSIGKQVFVDASSMKQQWVQMIIPALENLDLCEEDKETVIKTGSLQGTKFAELFPEDAAAFKTAQEISPEWHILVQAEWQREAIDESISKTINLPADATVEQIKELYLFAHKQDLKGITVYRSGTLESEPVKVGEQQDTEILNLSDGNEVEGKTYENGCKDEVCGL